MKQIGLGDMQNGTNTNIDRQLFGNPDLIEKLKLLSQSLNRMHIPFRGNMHVEEAVAGLQGEKNLSHCYRKTNRAIKDATLETAQDYSTSPEERTEFST